MGQPKTIRLNNGEPFAQGAIPYAIQHTFYNTAGTAIDLTGFTPTIKVDGPSTGPYGQGTVALTGTPTDGIVNYGWDTADTADIGLYEAIIWITDGDRQLHSDRIVWEVYDAAGTSGP